LNLAPPQKSSKFVDESTTLPLHTSKMIDGLHKLLPLLLHTHKKQNDKKINKSGSLSRGLGDCGVFFRVFFFSRVFQKNALFRKPKIAIFSFEKIDKLKNSQKSTISYFSRFLPINRRFLLLGCTTIGKSTTGTMITLLKEDSLD
jgi:hypothetical protein